MRQPGKGENQAFSCLPIPPTCKHLDTCLQTCISNDYHVLLIILLLTGRLLFDKIYRLGEFPFDWLKDWLLDCLIDWLIMECLFGYLKIYIYILLHQFDARNKWMGTCINDHTTITNEPTKSSVFVTPYWVFILETSLKVLQLFV